jgi:hypothetical protein
MPYEHAAFISWPHLKEELGRTFVENLHEALSGSLEPHVRQKVYIDKQRLIPGQLFAPALAQAMCASATWVVVYTPRYFEQDFCRREYAAMKLLEQERRTALGTQLPTERGMIIPVIFRGQDHRIREDLKDGSHYLDFRKFTLANPDIKRNDDYVQQIERLAEYIAELCEIGTEGPTDCATFELPPAPPYQRNGKLEFPGRPEAS